MPSILGALSPAQFLAKHWQKRALLVRQAIPGFRGILDRDTLLSLATRPDVVSRLVLEHPRRKQRWERHDGPFGGLTVDMLPKTHWTTLIHGVESLVPGAWELLRAFSFIPSARIDDLMVSYAVDGGSVGPHDDLYDVFLLQGPGRRRWQISSHRHAPDEFDSSAAIRVIKDFVPEEEWVLEPGDMLYLPPGVAHRGVAEGPCFTYSIGFLAPSHADVIQNFLGYLAQHFDATIDPTRLYADPDLRTQRDSLDVSDALMAQMTSILGAVRWDAALVEDFVGRFLTGPKRQTAFTPPSRPLSRDAFSRRLRKRGKLTLALPTRGLVRRGRLFLNGEGHAVKASTLRVFRALVHDRALALPAQLDEPMQALFHEWYVLGYVMLRS